MHAGFGKRPGKTEHPPRVVTASRADFHRPATALVTTFIAEHQGHRVGSDGLRWGVESICNNLALLGVRIAPSTYYEQLSRQPSKREVRDEVLKAQVERIHAANYGVYGARKVWLALRREGIDVARCTVERLMAELGLTGAIRGKVKKTTIADRAGRDRRTWYSVSSAHRHRTDCG